MKKPNMQIRCRGRIGNDLDARRGEKIATQNFCET